LARGGSTRVKYLPPHSKVKGSCPDTTVGIGQEKMALKYDIGTLIGVTVTIIIPL
jgi:hypothetical protein